MTSDLLVQNALIVIPEGGSFVGDIKIEDGRVAALGPGMPAEGATVFDASGLVALPGFVDPHVHLGNYRSFAEDCQSESVAAARGGVTTMLTFLKVLRHRDTEESYLPILDEVRAEIEAASLIDVGVHLALSTEQHLEELEAYHSLGVRSFKMYLGYRSDPAARKRGSVGVTDGYLRRAMGIIGGLTDAVALVHCENEDLATALSAQVPPDADWTFRTWADTRPALIEAEAVQRAALIASDADCPFYAVHVSSAAALAAIERTKGLSRKPMWVETNLHHLLLSAEDGDRFPRQGLAKVSPPLRSTADIDALWQALESGVAATVGTDHCAVDEAGKEGDARDALPGFPAMDNLSELVASAALERGLSLERLAAITSSNAARIFGLYPNKGTLLPGADGDVVLLRLDDPHTIDAGDNASYGKFSPYDGLTARARVVATIARGDVVYGSTSYTQDGRRGQLVLATKD